MPSHNIGDKTNLDKGNLFLQLKAKNEKVAFRLAQGNYTYTAKHFSKKDGKWFIEQCPRLMTEEPCSECEKYFALSKEIKELKEKKAPESKIKALDNERGLHKPKVTFHYAILNRDLKQAQVIQVPLSIRLKIEEYFNNGFTVVGSDFILTRTEKPGVEYYSFLKKDSADVVELDDEEKKEYKKAEEFNLTELTLAKEGSHNVEEPPVPEEQ